jgi:ATP-dependent Lhr-like helicase
VSAPTSAGKTEAAFLPILTRILSQDAPSIRVLYIGPLKALINDQFQRLDSLCENLDIPVHRWHGDVSSSAKSRLLKSPSGILLITPESLEAMLMRQGAHVANVFSHLEYVVVDEVHSFIGNERGAQLQSLLHRIESLIECRVPRIGLSATLSEPALAAEFLRPNGAQQFDLVLDSSAGAMKAQLRGFYRSGDQGEESEHEISAETAIIDHLMKTMCGYHNLVFCNRRSDVELYADALSERCRNLNLPDEFCAHHGNLSKEIREDAEARLKSKEKPATCVCTSTLEMGIDIGSMRSVGQIGPPPSVASLRQRVGRSGRRGEASVLRMIAIEDMPTAKSDLESRLHLKLVQSIASIELMAQGWCEPPDNRSLHLSTLIQQIMSLIVQRGGASIPYLYNLLAKVGSFTTVTQEVFVSLLKAMSEKGLVQQMDDGTLLLAPKGERIAEHFSFYAAFATPDEYQLIAEGKPIGSMPLLIPVKPGDPLLFAGKRWVIVDVDDTRKVILLRRSRGGRPPRFSGDIGLVHKHVREHMFSLLKRTDIPPFLDSQAQEMLDSARKTFQEYGLEAHRIITLGSRTYVFHWSGDREASTLRLLLDGKGLVVDPDPAILVIDADRDVVTAMLRKILSEPRMDELELASKVKNKAHQKHDWVLTEELLNLEFVLNSLDMDGALEIASRAL